MTKSTQLINRRQFLTLGAALALLPGRGVSAEVQSRRGAYSVDVGVMRDLMTFRLTGTLEGAVDPVAGVYQLSLAGQGSNVANRVESRGGLQGGRWTPQHTAAWFRVAGRESRSETIYDHANRVVDYHYRGESFVLGRLQTVKDRVTVPAGVTLDDTVSALLNYEFGLWTPGPDGVYRTSIVRRRRSEEDGPEDVERASRAELVPLEFRVTPEGATGKTAVVFDMTRFSSWAKPERPGRIVFGVDRRPEVITSSLMLGGSVTIRFRTL